MHWISDKYAFDTWYFLAKYLSEFSCKTYRLDRTSNFIIDVGSNDYWSF